MNIGRILTVIFASFLIAEARHHILYKRNVPLLCGANNNTMNSLPLQCYCIRDTKDESYIRSADCSLTDESLKENDKDWEAFSNLDNITKLTLTTNIRGIQWSFIPSKVFEYLKAVLKIDVKYGHINKIQPFAFSNCSTVQEISLSENQIHILSQHAIAYHKDLKVLNLDQNVIEEINRNVFVGLPSLESLFLTGNKITTVHDKAFLHLTNLIELEINMNSIFSLNSETFSGLHKLEKLDLGSNSLEVIGDDTFLPLRNLKTLNLEGNKIVMLDENAFNGLKKMQTLSLAHNKITDLDNPDVFKGLPAMTSLSLRGNELKELSKEILAPVMNNFYEKVASLDVEDTNLTCSCDLDWFLALMNRTLSKNLKIAMENLKCVPDAKLRDAWSKLDENEKSSPVGEEIPQSNDYEYYDESQLNGKLFYIDIRDLLNCNGSIKYFNSKLNATTKTVTSTKTTTKAETEKTYPAKITNHGTLDLSIHETTPNVKENDVKIEEKKPLQQKKPNDLTTTRLATVSEKPTDNKLYESMASDEAKPDKLKMKRNFDDDIKVKEMPVEKSKENDARRILSSVFLITIICFRLLY